MTRHAAEAVGQGKADEGILPFWTGTGVSIVANKVPSMRATLCDDAETARGTRLWNDANVLCLSLRRLSQAMALEILETWFPTTYTPNPEDGACVADVNAIETTYAASSPSSGVLNEKGNSST